MVAVVVEVVDLALRLGLVQPEHLHALVKVVALGDLPHEIPRAGVGGVEGDGVAAEVHGIPYAPVGARKVALLQHLFVVLAARIDEGPDGHHQLRARLVDLADHGLRVRELVVIEAPVALQRPVEEVHHDHVQRKAALFVLAQDGEQLVLGPVTQLALPEAHAVVGHHRAVAGGVGVGMLDLGGLVARGNPVVQRLGGPGLPLGHVLAEADAADRRVVPQKAVALGRNVEGHGSLGVPVRKLQHAAHLVQTPVLILAHAEDLLAGFGSKRMFSA